MCTRIFIIYIYIYIYLSQQCYNQIFDLTIITSTGFELTPLIHCSINRIAICSAQIKIVERKWLKDISMNSNCLPFRRTRVHPRFLVGFALLDLQCSVQCFVILSFFAWPFFVCPSIYGFCLLLCYLQAFLYIYRNTCISQCYCVELFFNHVTCFFQGLYR